MLTWRQWLRWILLWLVVLGSVALLIRLTGFTVPDIPTAIVGGALTLGLTHLLERQSKIHAEQYQRKIDAYSGFLEAIFAGVVSPTHKGLASKTEPTFDPDAFTDKFFEVSAKVGLWANNDALSKYTEILNRFMVRGGSDPQHASVDDLAEMILVFREDLGYGRGRLTTRSLYPLFGVPKTLGRTSQVTAKSTSSSAPPTMSEQVP